MYQTEEKKPVEGTVASAGVSSSDKNKVVKMFVIGFVGLLAAVMLVSVGVGVYRVYAKGDIDGFSLGVASALRLPVAKVNGVSILYKDYAEDLKAIRIMREYDKKHVDTQNPLADRGSADLSDEQLSDQVLIRQVSTVIIDKLARDNGITVEKSDIEKVKERVLVNNDNFKTIEEAEKAIKERYGWTMAEFEDKVITQFVKQDKLALKLNQSVEKQAQTVLEKIQGGANFEEMARQYGSDSTTSTGGDLGWFGKGRMIPDFENVVFSLKKGELYPKLVTTQFGYHIVRVDDIRTTKTKDSKGKTVSTEEVKARHILFQYPLGKIMNDLMKSASVKVYGKIHDPMPEIQNPPVPAQQQQ